MCMSFFFSNFTIILPYPEQAIRQRQVVHLRIIHGQNASAKVMWRNEMWRRQGQEKDKKREGWRAEGNMLIRKKKTI